MHVVKNCELQVQSNFIREDSFLKKNLGHQIKLGVQFTVLKKLYLLKVIS